MSKQQQNKKNKKKLRGKPRPRRSNPSRIVDGGFGVGRSSLPASVTTTYSRFLEIKEGKSASGHKVTKMVGRCLVAYVYAYLPAGIPQPQNPLLNATGSGTPVQILYLHPSIMFANTQSEEYAASSGYNKYRFTKLTFIYTGRCPSSQPGAVWIAYYPDGAIASGDFSSPGGVGFLPGAFNSSVWAGDVSANCDRYLDQNQWYYLDQDTDTDAGFRQSYQGALTAYWDPIPATQAGYGQVWMEYTLELCDPAGAFNFAGPLPPRPRHKSTAERAADRKALSVDAPSPYVVTEVPSSLREESLVTPSPAAPLHIASDGERVPSRRDRNSPQPSGRREAKERGMLGLW